MEKLIFHSEKNLLVQFTSHRENAQVSGRTAHLGDSPIDVYLTLMPCFHSVITMYNIVKVQDCIFTTRLELLVDLPGRNSKKLV